MAWLELVPDRFDSTIANVETEVDPSFAREFGADKAAALFKSNVRRPLRGLEQKIDVYSTIRIVKDTGQVVQILNSSALTKGRRGEDKYDGSTANYLVQQIQEQREEKSQVLQTFGDNFIFFFGERPRIINVSGMLINSEDFDWKNEFFRNYEEYLRGTKLVERRARMYLTLDNVIIEGYPLNVSASQSSDRPFEVPFRFSLFVTNYHYISQAPMREEVASTTAKRFDNQYNGLEAFERFNKQRVEEQGTLESILSGVTSVVNTIQDGINDVLEGFKRVAYGRKIRVPEGAAGVGQLVGPLQVSQRYGYQVGVSGDISLQDLLAGRRINLVPLNKPVFFPARYTGDVSDNLDEYPQYDNSVTRDAANRELAKAFDVKRKIPTGEEDKEVYQFLRDNGLSAIEVEGLSDAELVAGRIGFGLFSYGISSQIATGTRPRAFDNDEISL